MKNRSRHFLFVATLGLSLAACGGGDEGALADNSPAPNTPTIPAPAPIPTPTPAPTPTPTPTPPPSGGMSFVERCAQAGVIRCVGFDSPSDFNTGKGGVNGAYGSVAGILPPSGTSDYSRATMDTTVKASGAGSLRFTIPTNSPADTSGSYFTNFSDDLSLQFGENSEFFVQWRQRFSPELVTTKYAGGGGFKQIIIATGDRSSKTQGSCTAIHIVVTNYLQRGFPTMYNSCTGSASHGPYDNFFERMGTSDFKLQNGRPTPYCLYSQKGSSYFDPVGNCFGHVQDEWLTYQIRVKTGPRVGNEFTNSYVTLWAARAGKPSELIIDWGPYNLSAGSAADDQKYGKVWLLPYNTGKSAAEAHSTAYTWYDELVISRNKIADP